MTETKTNINTLEDVSRFIAQDDGLTASQRSQMRSAVNTFAKVAGKARADIIADPSAIRASRQQAKWKLAGLTKRRWANVLSLLTKAMERAGIKVYRSRRNLPLDACWEQLIARHPDENARHGLTRFAGWCSARGIMPELVGVEIFDQFLGYLREQSIQTNPRERWHVARRVWNRGVRLAGNWPQTEIPVGEHDRWRALSWPAFPASLGSDIEAYRTRMTREDMFEDEDRVIAPVTAENYIQRLKVLASLLVEDGVPVERFDRLEAFLDLDLVKRGLGLVKGGRTAADAAPTIRATINALLSIAKYLGTGEEVAGFLRGEKVTKKYRNVPTGMTAKNKARLGQLEDDAARQSLLTLPLKVARELAGVKNPTVKQALRYQMAVLVEVLHNAPMRIKNVAALDIDRHINRPPDGSHARWRIHIPAEEVKNKVELDFPLMSESGYLIERYFQVFRPVLCKSPCSALFVSQHGTRKSASILSKQFRKFIRQELGLEINAHLMRHFAAFNYLRENPGDYETVRQFLGHKDIETTIRFYAGMEIEKAFERYDALIAEQRGLAADLT